ncbi:Glycogen phosphorylase [Marinobacter nitratireducens]|uniref:Glycogen phosphorylase n=1 Tax=Marinobacter nitratireducens TaxID=1137280 RepID=A0A072N571_9GAMM|nr:alpha-glucan family phosphorylase [Marinobacter nitratireducens]KEF32427.1 Glycogen phosphorylase [Marinobacter nitratireducens]
MTLAAYTPRHVPEALSGLFDIALDLRWTWHHGSDELWRAIDQEVWDATGNAWLVLNSVSGECLESLAQDPAFMALYSRQLESHREFTEAPTWYSDTHPDELGHGIAFFCMEYGLAESLPLYSGGLGVLAGDFLKASSDLGVPVTAVGLLYQQGYFRQALNAQGEQQEFYPYNDPTMLPVSPLTDSDGQWIRILLPFPGRELRLRAWRARVGRCQLLLLDSNDPRNEPGDRGITSELYGGTPEKRLQQEIVLGIGGWRLLSQLGLAPDICHINEGHSAFAFLERAVSWALTHDTDFDTARVANRASNLFTTHTSVEAGFDQFPNDLIRLYLEPWMAESHVSMKQLMKLGSSSGGHSQRVGDEGTFNMAYLGLNLCGRLNGVSAIHSEVTQAVLQPYFPRWPKSEIPAEYVTNGVHTPSWDSREADTVWTRACGKDRWRRPMESSCPMECISDEELWGMRQKQRSHLVSYLRSKLQSQHCEHVPGGNPPAMCGLLLDSETLTLGFARRFTEYKRPDLLLTDTDRLAALINDRDRPLQIVLAGKAHPRDDYGKVLIRRWREFATRPDVEGKVVFIEDYDLAVAAHLVQGVDVWLNNPRHPWEACGTSGMKVLVNGGLNLSQYDGWWAEAWTPELGWAIRPGATVEELSQNNEHDFSDANELYDLLEGSVIPEFYDVDEEARPKAWINRIRGSMNRLTARYSANRMVREYTENFYLPMVSTGSERSADEARAMVEEYRQLECDWPKLRFAGMEVEEGREVDTIKVNAFLNGVSEERIRVELVAEESDYGPREVIEMQRIHSLEGAVHGFAYQACVSKRPAGHFTPRIRVQDDRLNLPLENASILWLK